MQIKLTIENYQQLYGISQAENAVLQQNVETLLAENKRLRNDLDKLSESLGTASESPPAEASP